jgi:farnesyl-diphosphate farnesyltransferase
MGLADDRAYQQQILPLVSRTFALTIPQLPAALEPVVVNAYLVCRLADTIEDDAHLDSQAKSGFMDEFLRAVAGQADANAFARRLLPELSRGTSASERDLVACTSRVLSITGALPTAQRSAVVRGVTIMGTGMPEFQRQKSLNGLANLEEMDRYCYFVAGVVGEMLTDLFCDYCPDLEPHRDEMMNLAVCFGQGLQMTNILKDIWEDRDAGTCWLPRSLFADVDGGLFRAMTTRDSVAIATGIDKLIGVAHAHLRSALRYTELIPPREAGIRRFCLWAIGMAILTLQKIHANPGFLSGQTVKISRRAVRATMLACRLAQRSNDALELLFELSARGLPRDESESLCPPRGARLASDRLA